MKLATLKVTYNDLLFLGDLFPLDRGFHPVIHIILEKRL